MTEIASDKNYLDGKMDSIISTASNGSTGITIDSSDYTSTSRIPSAEPTIENTLLTHINILFQKIVKEAQSIKAVGVDFKDMDNFLEGASTSLGFDIVSKNEPLVELVDYSNMNFEDLLNANIPNVPTNYRNNNGGNYGGSGGNSGASNSYGSTPQSPTTSSTYPTQSGSTPSSTSRTSDSSTSGYDYTLPDYSSITSDRKVDTSRDSTSSSKTSDYNPLEGFDSSKKSTTTDRDSITSDSSGSRTSSGVIGSDDGLVRLSATNKGGTNSRYPGYTYVNTGNKSNTYGDDIIDSGITPFVDETVQDDLIPEDYIESFVDNNDINNESNNEVVNDIPNTQKGGNRTLRSLGIAAGVGLAAGAVALGAHSMMKSKEDYEDEEYGYESSGDY